MGVDLAHDTRVELTLHAGEPGPGIPATRALLERIWGSHVGDFLGMTETAGITAYQCNEMCGGLHVSEDYFLEEVLDLERALGRQDMRGAVDMGLKADAALVELS